VDDNQFQQLLERLGLAWPGYRKVRKGVKKRLVRHMQELGCQRIDTYLDLVSRNADVRSECLQRMTVSISRFYRDRKLWSDLMAVILPEILADRRGPVRVWSAGCARGEEIYSFRILWESLRQQRKDLPALELIATDMVPDYLVQARCGSYAAASVKDVPGDLLDTCFYRKKGGRRYEIKPFLKSGVRWVLRDLLDDPPGDGFDLIFLRNNLLTYYLDPLKIPALHRIVDSLASEGWLIIGSHERIPDGFPAIARHPSIPWAWKKTDASRGEEDPDFD